jgi:chemosensory pili system protein ChpE
VSQLLAAFLLGIAFCAPPGAVNAESLRRGLAHGARSALAVQCGSLLGDLFWAVAAVLGLGFIASQPAIRLALSGFGAALLVALAWQSLRSAAQVPALRSQPRNTGGSLAIGIALSLGNPWGPAFWAGAGLSLATGGGPTGTQAPLFLGGFFLGALTWALLFSCLLAWGRQFLQGAAMRWASAASGLILLVFAIRLVLSLWPLPR